MGEGKSLRLPPLTHPAPTFSVPYFPVSLTLFTSDPLKTVSSDSDRVMVKEFSGARLLDLGDGKSLYSHPIPSEKVLRCDPLGHPLL